MRDLLGESIASRLDASLVAGGAGGGGGSAEGAAGVAAEDRTSVRRKDENLEAQVDDCEWVWDASSTARSVATSVVDGGKEVKKSKI